MPSLVFLAGPIAGRRYKLGDGEYVIGRRSDCQIFVPDMRVSRQHARLVRNGEGWPLEDLGSNNGTYINGVRLQSATPIRHDDEIMIANNKIRVEAQDFPSQEKFPEGGNAVTLVDALLALFPQAEDVGVLVQDERTQELKVQVQRHRKPPLASGETAPLPRTTTEDDLVKKPYGGELRVPGTIIQHVVSDGRGVLLGEGSADNETVGTRMGAPLIYHGAHFGVVYVESGRQSFRQEDVDLLQAIANQAGMAIHATRVAAQLARREKLERDLRVARQIQRSLLPQTLPQVVGLDFAVHYEPAYQIGGDFYNNIKFDTT